MGASYCYEKSRQILTALGLHYEKPVWHTVIYHA